MAITEQQRVNAIEAGLEVDFYHFLYFDGLDGQRLQYAHQWPKPRIMWLDCEYEDKASVGYVITAIDNARITFLKDGIAVGVYTRKDWWEGHAYNSEALTNSALWYAHYDGIENFDDFQPFGGWDKPSMKQYQGDAHVAGILCDLNCYLA